MNRLMERFAADRSGATAIEYGLMAALIAVALIAALLNLGPAIESGFGVVADSFENVGT